MIGLHFYNARYYNSSLGRFVEADTIVPLAVQGVQAWDRYAYVNNSPVNFSDPSGNMLCSPYRPCEPTNNLFNKKNPPVLLPPSTQIAVSGYGTEVPDRMAGFDPYYGAFVGMDYPSELGELIELSRSAAGRAYSDKGIDLDSLAERGEYNPLSAEDIDSRMKPNEVGMILQNNMDHREYVVFLHLMGNKLGKSDFKFGFMQYESTYLDALMKHHPDVLGEAKNYMFDNYWSKPSQGRDIMDLLENIEGTGPG